MEETLRRQASEGRLLAMEVDAAPGRRAFIELRPQGGAKTLEESLALARTAGATPSAQGFDVVHVEYDAQALDGWDYDVSRVIHARVAAASLPEVEEVIAAWGFDS